MNGGIALLLLFIIGVILMYVIPPDDHDDFDHEAIAYRTEGEWKDEDL